MLLSIVFFRVSEVDSLINSHIYVPECVTGSLLLPALCNCGQENSCDRLTTGNPTRAVLFDTKHTFVCAYATRNDTVRYRTLFMYHVRQKNCTVLFLRYLYQIYLCSDHFWHTYTTMNVLSPVYFHIFHHKVENREPA